LLGVLALQACTLFSTTEEQPSRASASGLHVVWGAHVDLRRPLSPAANSTPAAGDGYIVIGGRDARLHIYSRNGTEVRRVALRAPGESGALLIGRRAIVGDTDGNLYAIDVSSGRIVWQQLLSSVLLGHPVRAGDGFLVQTADNRVYSLDMQGGKRWSLAGQPGGLSMNQGPSPLVVDGRAYAVFNNGDVVAIALDSGNLIWRRQLILDNSAAVLSEMRVPVADPVMVAGRLIVSFFQGELLALNPDNGEQQWRRGISLKSTPLAHDGRLYVASGKGDVMALDGGSGETLWRQHVSDTALVGPVALSDRLIVADEQGGVHALTFAGQPAGSLEIPGRIDRIPVAAGKGVLIRNDLGGMYLIR